jgi:hypothetical protein
MARPSNPAREFSIQGLCPRKISIDPEVEDEITMCKFWVLRMRLLKNRRVDRRFGTSPCWLRVGSISNKLKGVPLNVGNLV